MDIIFGVLLLCFSSLLLIIGFWKSQAVLIVFSGISFFILGILFFNGFEYVSGVSESYNYGCGGCLDDRFSNSSNSTVLLGVVSVNVYSEWNNVYSVACGVLFVLFGAFLWLVSGVLLFAPESKGVFFNSQDDDVED